MLHSTHRRWLLPTSAVVLVAGAFAMLGSACGGDDGGSGDAEVINAINILDNAGLHDIDESINDDKTIPATAKATAQKLQAVTELTEWPDELQDEAEALVVVFEELVAALEGANPDMAKAGEAASKAHDGQHDFSHDVWAHLYSEAAVDTGDEADGH